MARGNGRTISVKLPTKKVITALQQALAKLELDYAMQDEAEAKYQKAIKEWKEDIQKWALDNFSKAENVRVNYASYKSALNVDFDIICKNTDFPIEPEKNYNEIQRHTYKEMSEEISNAIRILQLTDEEVVSTSTYNSIAKYL